MLSLNELTENTRHVATGVGDGAFVGASFLACGVAAVRVFRNVMIPPSAVGGGVLPRRE